MPDEPSWDQIFGDTRASGSETPERHAPAPQAGVAAAADEVRREERDRRRAELADEESLPRRRDVRVEKPEKPYRPRRKIRWGLLVFFLCFLLAIGGTGWALWGSYGQQVQEFLGVAEPNDFEGDGNGQEVTVVINQGDIGEDVARTLVQVGVTKTFDAFYDLLLADPDVAFEAGNYALQERMSAASALATLQDPASRVLNTVQIPEGSNAANAFAQLSAATGLPVADFEAAAADFRALGVPDPAPSIEGFIFPATYTFEPGVTARDALQRTVSEMIARLDAAGVAPERRFDLVRLASIVQRESGPNLEDMGKIARVFQNRLDQGINLESDATVAFGTGNYESVFTTDAERADAANPYNTYANPGLPVGPIGLPREAAIQAAVNPAAGDWLYFVTVNLATGETQFSTTLAEHEAGVARLQDWCRTADTDGLCD